jgi:hypothetical protein
VGMTFENLNSIFFFFVFAVVLFVLKITKKDYNSDNIALALILGGFAGFFLYGLLNLFTSPIISILISSIILAFLFKIILQS